MMDSFKILSSDTASFLKLSLLWSEKSIPKQINLSDLTNLCAFTSEHSFTQTVWKCIIIHFKFVMLDLPFHVNFINKFHEVKAKLIWVLQVIERILLLLRLIQVMIQVIQRYETNDFSVFKSIESHYPWISYPNV